MFKWIRSLVVFVVVFIISIQCYRIHANIQHVLTYESLVKEVLAEDDIKNTTSVDLVLAMIYTETKGKTDDVMQSSESSTVHIWWCCPSLPGGNPLVCPL